MSEKPQFSIDDRLDRLTERHEAPAESVQLLLASTQQLHATTIEHTQQIRDLLAKSRQDGENIAALGRIAGAH